MNGAHAGIEAKRTLDLIASLEKRVLELERRLDAQENYELEQSEYEDEDS